MCRCGCSSLLPIGEKEVTQGFDVLNFATEFAFIAEALGGLHEKFFEHLFHDRFDLLTICGREMRGLREARVEKGGAVLAKARAEGGDEADEFNAGLPREKL